MQTLLKYSTQSKSQKKYSRLNEIPTGKHQLPSSACSTNTLGMGQLTHSKIGLHNFNMDRFFWCCQFWILPSRASAVSLVRETSYCGAFPTRRPTLQHSPSGSFAKYFWTSSFAKIVLRKQFCISILRQRNLQNSTNNCTNCFFYKLFSTLYRFISTFCISSSAPALPSTKEETTFSLGED